MRNLTASNWMWIAATTAVLALAGCGPAATSESPREAPTRATGTAGEPLASAPIGLPEQSVPTVSSTPLTSANVVVPNGVGKDYQTAQDMWRSAGLLVAPAHDATGAHRLPMLDSNWVVLSQNPRAGTKVDVGSLVTATVKKYTDD